MNKSKPFMLIEKNKSMDRVPVKKEIDLNDIYYRNKNLIQLTKHGLRNYFCNQSVHVKNSGDMKKKKTSQRRIENLKANEMTTIERNRKYYRAKAEILIYRERQYSYYKQHQGKDYISLICSQLNCKGKAEINLLTNEIEITSNCSKIAHDYLTQKASEKADKDKVNDPEPFENQKDCVKNIIKSHKLVDVKTIKSIWEELFPKEKLRLSDECLLDLLRNCKDDNENSNIDIEEEFEDEIEIEEDIDSTERCWRKSFSNSPNHLFQYFFTKNAQDNLN